MPKVNLGIKTVCCKAPYGNRYVSAWDKVCRRGQALLKNNANLARVPLRDTVVISKEEKPQIKIPTPGETMKEMVAMGIAKLRVLDTRTYSGETLEDSPEKLAKLKSLGINTVVDFREESGQVYKKMCEDNGLEFFYFPLKHSGKFDTKNGVNDEFVDKMKGFFDIYNKGNAYFGCKWGLDRTNIALTMNYLLNTTSHMAPEILAWGGESVKSVINKDKKIIENLFKALTPSQKEKLDLSDAWRDVMKKRTKRLIEKNKY